MDSSGANNLKIRFSPGKPVPYTCKVCSGEYTLVFVEISNSEKESWIGINRNTKRIESKTNDFILICF